MKNSLPIIFFLILTVSLKSQIFNIDQEGLNFYDQGTNLLRNGNYAAADSMLSLALCTYSNENVYFNRAVSRLFLKDTINACKDFLVAAKTFYDNQAEEFYNRNCCSKVDTFYYDRKKQVLNSGDKYRYYEIIKYPKYDTNIWGTYHDIKSKTLELTGNIGCDNNVLGFQNRYTDVIGAYIIKWNRKFYYFSVEPAMIYDEIGYNKTMKNAKNYLNAKYPDLIIESDDSSKNIELNIFYNNDGHAINFEILNAEFIRNFKNIETELRFDLLQIINKYPKVTPAKFFKDPVDFIITQKIEL